MFHHLHTLIKQVAILAWFFHSNYALILPSVQGQGLGLTTSTNNFITNSPTTKTNSVLLPIYEMGSNLNWNLPPLREMPTNLLDGNPFWAGLIENNPKVQTLLSKSKGLTNQIFIEPGDVVVIKRELAKHPDFVIKPFVYCIRSKDYFLILVPGKIGIRPYNAYFIKTHDGSFLTLGFLEM